MVPINLDFNFSIICFHLLQFLIIFDRPLTELCKHLFWCMKDSKSFARKFMSLLMKLRTILFYQKQNYTSQFHFKNVKGIWYLMQTHCWSIHFIMMYVYILKRSRTTAFLRTYFIFVFSLISLQEKHPANIATIGRVSKNRFHIYNSIQCNNNLPLPNI